MNIFQELNNKKVKYSVLKELENECIRPYVKLGTNYYLIIKSNIIRLDGDQVVNFKRNLHEFKITKENESKTIYKKR